MRNYSRMKNQVTVSINQPSSLKRKTMAHSILPEVGLTIGRTDKIILTTPLVIVTAHRGEATALVPNGPGARTAVMKTAFI